MITRAGSDQWVQYNHLTDSYDTPDGTSVPAMLVDTADSLLDILYIAKLREEQRNND